MQLAIDFIQNAKIKSQDEEIYFIFLHFTICRYLNELLEPYVPCYN